MNATEIPEAWVDESMGEHPLFMVRRWKDGEQAVFHPRGTDGQPNVNRFVLSQVCLSDIPSSRRQQQFVTFQDTIEAADRWYNKTKPNKEGG